MSKSKTRLLSIISTLVIHCSATPNGREFTAKDIDLWHKRRGFQRDEALISPDYPLSYIGYHFVITLDGTIVRGRRPDEVGAHAQGYNTNSLGICLIGTDKYTPAQWQALSDVVDTLMHNYRITDVLGHRDLSPDKNGDGKIEPSEWLKTCPGFDVAEWLRGGRTPLTAHTVDPAAQIKPATLPGDQPASESYVIDPQEQAGYPGIDDAILINGALPIDVSKPWWQSKTILAAITAMLPSVAHLFGIDETLLVPYSADIITILGAGLAIVGRKTAVNSIRPVIQAKQKP